MPVREKKIDCKLPPVKAEFPVDIFTKIVSKTRMISEPQVEEEVEFDFMSEAIKEEISQFIKLIIVEKMRPFGPGAVEAVEKVSLDVSESIIRQITRYTAEYYFLNKMGGVTYDNQPAGQRKLSSPEFIEEYWGAAIDDGLPLESIWQIDRALNSALNSYVKTYRGRGKGELRVSDFGNKDTMVAADFKNKFLKNLGVGMADSVELRRLADRQIGNFRQRER